MTREEAKDYIREWCPYDRQEEIIKALEQEPCEDSISRQAVLDIVNNPLNIRLDEIIKKLPSVSLQEPKTGHWIPVSERLPEEETDVLICNENGDIELSRGSYSTEVENDFIWYTSGWRFGKVIAWMPLPDPYKKESE